jgi:hypothetical protein
MPRARGGRTTGRVLLAAAALLALVPPARACYIQGQDSGECRSAASLVAAGDLSYCGTVISSSYDSVCVPRTFGGTTIDFITQKPFGWGLFPNHTVRAKDAWVGTYTANAIARRLQIEEKNGEGLTLRA